ncbi:MAG TPA: (d)CMP kinase [Terriglobia bacterium]|nr:(d)CMP kinase [Terriglobia bacterium]
MGEPLVIAIDGPAGAGKSTVAKMLAARLGLSYVDSGATYRAAALKVLESGVSPDEASKVTETISQAEIAFEASGGKPRVLLDGREVTDKIRTSEVTLAAAKVSRLPEVRIKLVAMQRAFARGRGVVMEGRDIGTVVFPAAPLKIFLEADREERARRRLEQNHEEGRASTLEDTAYELGRRDQLDAERKISPLVAANDAVAIDSTHLTADEVVRKIVELARERGLVGASGTPADSVTGNS